MDESIDNEVIIDRSSLSISAPMVVNELYDGILYSGFFGNLDSARMRAICEAMLSLAKDKEADFIIVDLSCTEIIDTPIASLLLQTAAILKLTGVEIVFCGIQSLVARSIVNADMNLESLLFKKNLKTALGYCFNKLQLEIKQTQNA